MITSEERVSSFRPLYGQTKREASDSEEGVFGGKTTMAASLSGS